MGSITSANAKLTFTVRGRGGLPIVGPFTVQGFASDDAFAVETVESAQAVMGVDGKLSAGFVPNPAIQTITLQADSPSRRLFDDWYTAQARLKDVVVADGVLLLEGPGVAYALAKGYLTQYTPMPQGKKILQPMTYQITWETVQPAPLGV